MKHSISAINFYLLYLLVIISLVMSSGCMIRNTDSSQERLEQSDPNYNGEANNDGGVQHEQNQNDGSKNSDAGKANDAARPDSNQSDMGSAHDATIVTDAAHETTFSSADAGFSVTLPEGTRVEQSPVPAWAADDALAAATVTQGEDSYVAVVYPRNDTNSIQEWAAQSTAGESFTPADSVTLESGQAGEVFLTDDLGLLPNIHVVVMGEQNIYYFKWDAGLPEDPEEAAEIIKRQELTFPVPDELLNLMRATSVR